MSSFTEQEERELSHNNLHPGAENVILLQKLWKSFFNFF